MTKLVRARMAITALWLAAACGACWGVRIPRDGTNPTVIVVAPKASLAEQHAAKELQHFLNQVTGAKLQIVNATRQDPKIFVGPDAARMADAKFSTDGLETDGIVIRTIGNDLILAGGGPRGTLYAVYTFLEDYVGCRWWAPDASTIPKRGKLSFDNLNVRYVPVFAYREPFWYSAFNKDWAVRNKALGTRIPLDEQTGGKPAISHIHHSFYQLIPPKQYLDTHPEWFNETNGKRGLEGNQLCLSNEELRAEVVKNILARLRKQRKLTNVSVAQNDGGGSCQCAKCKAIDAEEGSPSGAMMRFVNGVAEEVEKEFPNVIISTFAYTYSKPPPKITKPRRNVIVWLCTMNASYNWPLNASRRSESFADALLGWSKMAHTLYIWDYVTNFHHYLFMHPNLRVLGPNIRFFAANNVRGVFEQGAQETPGAEMMELRAWVIAKLLWNPDLDDDKLITEFLDGYYGAAGKHIRAYIDLVHDVNQARHQPLGCYEEPTRAFMEPGVLGRSWKHLKEAEAAVGGDPVLTRRVKTVQMPVMYAYMIRWQKLLEVAKQKGIAWPMGDDPHAVLAEYKALAAEIGITHVQEGVKFDKLEAKLKLPEKVE